MPGPLWPKPIPILDPQKRSIHKPYLQCSDPAHTPTPCMLHTCMTIDKHKLTTIVHLQGPPCMTNLTLFSTSIDPARPLCLQPPCLVPLYACITLRYNSRTSAVSLDQSMPVVWGCLPCTAFTDTGHPAHYTSPISLHVSVHSHYMHYAQCESAAETPPSHVLA
jgi:hypothetical protein